MRKMLALAIASLTLALAPTAAADERVEIDDGTPLEQGTGCKVFSYSIEPPGYRLDPDCLTSPPSGEMAPVVQQDP